MPPKKQITKETILTKAYEIASLNGFDSISARSLAKELNCSTQPIYHAFSDMLNLKTEIIKLACLNLFEFIKASIRKDIPEDLGIVLGYIKYALQEKKLFQLVTTSGMLFSKDWGDAAPINYSNIDKKMIIFANGIIMMTSFNTMKNSWESIEAITIEAYEAFKKCGNDKC